MPKLPGSMLGLVGLAAAALSSSLAGAQVQFGVTETFENSCPTLCLGEGYTGAWGVWTKTTLGFQGGVANEWYISCAENGNAPVACGTGCGSDESLHVGSIPYTGEQCFSPCPPGDCGAAYDDTDPFWCDSDSTTDKRVESPLIDCTARSGISVQYDWIGYGQPGVDFAQLVYSPDGGANWSVITTHAGGTTCGAACGFFGSQGSWALATGNLPATANNNPNVRIGFRWRNFPDDLGCDPSFAVDDIRVRAAAISCAPAGPIPMDLVGHLRLGKSGNAARLDWSSMTQAGTTTHFHVYRATAPSSTFPTSWTKVAGDAPALTAMTYDDAVLPSATTYYYDVRSANNCEGICPKPMCVVALSDAPSCDNTGRVYFSPWVSGGQQPFTYSWAFGDLSPNGTTGSALHNYSYPPYSYNAVLTVTDATPGAPQVRVSSTAAGVGPGNVSDVPTQDSPKPAGVAVSFTSNPSGGAPPYFFSWNFGDASPLSGLQNPSHAYASAGTYSANVVVRDSAGCLASTPLVVTITP